SYEVTNPGTNSGSIWLFGIDVKRPLGAINLGGEGLQNGPGYLQATSQLVRTDLGSQLIPVGLQSPQNWVSGLSNSGRAEWTALDAGPLIGPGQTSSGFQLTSRGL